MTTDHQRWFWRMPLSQRHDTQRDYESNRFWDQMMARFRDQVPRQLARLQFEAAMELVEGISK